MVEYLIDPVGVDNPLPRSPRRLGHLTLAFPYAGTLQHANTPPHDKMGPRAQVLLGYRYFGTCGGRPAGRVAKGFPTAGFMAIAIGHLNLPPRWPIAIPSRFANGC